MAGGARRGGGVSCGAVISRSLEELKGNLIARLGKMCGNDAVETIDAAEETIRSTSTMMCNMSFAVTSPIVDMAVAQSSVQGNEVSECADGTMFHSCVYEDISDDSEGDLTSFLDPSIVLHVLSLYNLDSEDLACLEVAASFFKRPANISPHVCLSIAELAALYMCDKQPIFRKMDETEKESLRKRCGGSWKLVLKYLRAGEAAYRRGMCQVYAGNGYSVLITEAGEVFTFGSNSEGQLGHGDKENQFRPRVLRSLQGVRVTQASVGKNLTMLVTETGHVYSFGHDAFSENGTVSTPKLIESLNGIFILQTAIGHYFSAVLSKEGNVYTFAWGSDTIAGHASAALYSRKPWLLKGDLENVPVVQIAAGHCYLLALTFQPNRMSVYSVGCGLGGKLGHGIKTDEAHPRRIEHFERMNFRPIALAAGAWHAVAVGQDGRLCTWGWGTHGCLGHGNYENENLPKVVTALEGVKVVHATAGDLSTFVVTDNGDVYSFGHKRTSLGHLERAHGLCVPELVISLKQLKERISQISVTQDRMESHTLVLTDSGKVYAFGHGGKGQLGIKLADNNKEVSTPLLVNTNLD